MVSPEIIIKDKKHHPGKPKAGVWRDVMEFDEGRKKILAVDFLDEHSKIISKVFAVPEVTPEAILDTLGIEDIIPLYFSCFSWVCEQINVRLEKLPNPQTPKAEE